MPNADTIRDVENDSNLTTFIPADYTDVGQAAVLSQRIGINFDIVKMPGGLLIKMVYGQRLKRKLKRSHKK